MTRAAGRGPLNFLGFAARAAVRAISLAASSAFRFASSAADGPVSTREGGPLLIRLSDREAKALAAEVSRRGILGNEEELWLALLLAAAAAAAAAAATARAVSDALAFASSAAPAAGFVYGFRAEVGRRGCCCGRAPAALLVAPPPPPVELLLSRPSSDESSDAAHTGTIAPLLLVAPHHEPRHDDPLLHDASPAPPPQSARVGAHHVDDDALGSGAADRIRMGDGTSDASGVVNDAFREYSEGVVRDALRDSAGEVPIGEKTDGEPRPESDGEVTPSMLTELIELALEIKRASPLVRGERPKRGVASVDGGMSSSSSSA